MIVMKVRYEMGDINLKVSNMSPRDTDSYVLLKAADESGNEIVFALSNDQAERLEVELYEANRRRRFSSVSSSIHGQHQSEMIAPPSSNDEEISH